MNGTVVQVHVPLDELRSSRLRSSPILSPSLSASSKGGVDGGALSIQSAAMPTALAYNGIGRRADVRFVQRLLQEDVDGQVRAGHVHKHRELGLVLQLAERLRIFCHSTSGCPPPVKVECSRLNADRDDVCLCLRRWLLC